MGVMGCRKWYTDKSEVVMVEAIVVGTAVAVLVVGGVHPIHLHVWGIVMAAIVEASFSEVGIPFANLP